MANFMNSDINAHYVQSTTHGVEKVRESKGKYAFLMESAVAEYFTSRHCDLATVGGLLNSKGYGIALPSGNKY